MLPKAPFPSFCSGATYFVFIRTIETLRERGQLQLDFATLNHLIIRDQRDGEDVRYWHTLDEDYPVTIAEQRRHSQVTGNHNERLYAEGPEEEAQMDLLPGNKASEPESDETQHKLHTAPGCDNYFNFPESNPNQADIEADAGQARGMQAEEQGEQAMP